MTKVMENFLCRMQLQTSLHQILKKKGYQQVATSCIQPQAGLDSQIDPFLVHYRPAMEPRVEEGNLYLHTSPEFAMKRLLSRGMKNIYQIGPVFRQGELGPLHSPEFTMAEWYHNGWTWTELMHEVEQVIIELVGKSLSFRDRTVELAPPFPRISVLDAMEEKGVNTAQWDKLSDPDYAEAFYRAYVDALQPWLDQNNALFLVDFPQQNALLSRLQPHRPELAERFELIISGVELANGCTELTDPAEHKKRFEKENAIRQKLGKDPLPFPERLFRDIQKFGMPPCAGVALGVDRLAMLYTAAENIEQVQAHGFAD